MDRKGLLLVSFVLASVPTVSRAAPPNDDRANAEVVATLPFSTVPEYAGSTFESGEQPGCPGTLTPGLPAPLGPDRGSLWYRFTPTTSQKILFRETRNFGRSSLSIFRPGSSEPVACEFEGAHSDIADLIVDVVAGETYEVQLAGDIQQGAEVNSFAISVAPEGRSRIASLAVTEGTVPTPLGNMAVSGIIDITVTFDAGGMNAAFTPYEVAVCARGSLSSCTLIADDEIEDLSFFPAGTATRTYRSTLPGVGDLSVCAWIDPGSSAEVDPSDNVAIANIHSVIGGSPVDAVWFSGATCEPTID